MLRTIARHAPLTLAATAFTFALHVRAQGPTTEAHEQADGTLRVRTLEVLGEDGRVALRLGSNEFGGTLELFRPRTEDETTRFAFLGSTGKGDATFELGSPSRPGSGRIALGVEGEGSAPFLRGGGESSPTFALGGADTSEGVLRLREADGELRFAR